MMVRPSLLQPALATSICGTPPPASRFWSGQRAVRSRGPFSISADGSRLAASSGEGAVRVLTVR